MRKVYRLSWQTKLTKNNSNNSQLLEYDLATLLNFSGITSSNKICYYISSKFPSHIKADIEDYLELIKTDSLKKPSTLTNKNRINSKQTTHY